METHMLGNILCRVRIEFIQERDGYVGLEE